MSKSWKAAPPEGRRYSKPRHEPTIEEELEEMNPEEIFIVMSEDQPIRTNDIIEEAVAYHRSRDTAWLTLQSIAEGVGCNLPHGVTSFEVDDNAAYEYRCWYITTGILED